MAGPRRDPGRLTRRRLLAFLLVPAALSPWPGAARAQERPVLVVSRKRLLTETRQAKLLRDAEIRMGSELQARIDRIKEALNAEEKELADLRGRLERDVFNVRVATFDRKVRRQRRWAHQFAANLRNALQAERLKLVRAIGPVLATIRAERGAAVIIDADQVLAADPAIDVTDEAIARFDDSVPMPTLPDLDSLAPPAEDDKEGQ